MGVDFARLVLASIDGSGPRNRQQVAFLAFLLAMVLAWVGGARVGVQHGDLGVPTDIGLAGASAERAQADQLPTGKPSSEALAQESSESEDDSEPIVPAIGHSIEGQTQWFAARATHETDATSAMRAWLLFASIGARGPPVG